MDLRLQTPARIILLGPSMSGKSTWLLELLKNQEKTFKEEFDFIVYCTGIEQPEFEKKLKEYFSPDLKIFYNLPTEKILTKKLFINKKNPCIILDDMASEIKNTKILSDLFTKISHHTNLTVILTVQTLFWPGESMKIANRNATHFIIFKSPREGQGIRLLSRQIFPSTYKCMIDAYEKVTETPFACLVVDLTPSCHKHYRLRSNIFSDDNYSVFVPENESI